MSKKPYVLAIDEGTSGVTALLIDEDGKIRWKAYHEIPQIYPQPGWVEQDPEIIFVSSLLAARECIEKLRVPPDQIRAIGITGQRETTVVWDRLSGKSVGNALVWQCRRTAALCEELKLRGLGPIVREKTGLLIDAYFSATKIRWILDHLPDGQKRAVQGDLLFGTIDSWLIWKLTRGRVHATDYTNASRTMLFDIRALNWDMELLEALNIPRAMLPEVMPSSHIFGETAELFPQKPPIPIGAVAGDQQASLFGQACYDAGMAKNTYGTGSFVLMNTGPTIVPSEHGLVTTIAWGEEGKTYYALEGSIFVTGSAIQWLRDGLGLIRNASETEHMALSIGDNGGVYFVPALTGLGAPYWDMYARGMMVGLTRGTTREHLTRSTLEAIAYQTRDVITAMQSEAKFDIPLLRVDGGGADNSFLMQFQADILNVPIQRSATRETTALGVGYLAGLSTGLWHSTSQISQNWSPDRIYEPAMGQDQREALYLGWKRAVASARAWSSQERSGYL